MLNRTYVSDSRWAIYDRKVRGMLIQPAGSQPGLVKGTVVCWKTPCRVDNRTSSTLQSLRHLAQERRASERRWRVLRNDTFVG
ncbi:hypothetical protein TNCV_2970441 [Trichonephila clavipes]|nr:hypothetical protein TNCV_2970441 [Trichonephila clavipes]